MTDLNWRLKVAAVLLLLRGGWTGLTGISFLGFAAIFWATNHGSRGPTPESSLIGDAFTIILVGGLAVIGVVDLVIAIPSLAFGFLILRRKRRALWAAALGESFLAVALLGVTIWALSHPGDRGLAPFPAAALVLVSIPVLVLLAPSLRLRRNVPAGQPPRIAPR
jgi:hypothetical protein